MKIRNLLLAVISATALLFSSSIFAADSFTPQQTQALQKIIHNYIVNNPQVLVEAGQKLQAMQQQKATAQAEKAIVTQSKALFDSKNSPVVGNKNGNINLVEFFDYQCIHCKHMAPIIKALIKNNSNLRVVFKEMPIFGDNSVFAAKAALAAEKQGKFFAFHNALLKAQNPLTNKKVLDIAKQVGLNVTQLQTDMKSSDIMGQITADYGLARDMALVGTPAFVVANVKNGQVQGKAQFIPGAVSEQQLQKAIQAVS